MLFWITYLTVTLYFRSQQWMSAFSIKLTDFVTD